MADNDYVNPDVLVDTHWVARHLDDPSVRLVETDEDAQLYETGHLPGAVMLDWRADLRSEVIRDLATKEEFEAVMESCGITNDMTVVFYGDSNNWCAAYAYWLFKLYGHRDCRIMNGGRARWDSEGREYSRETPSYPRSTYRAKPADLTIRAFRDQVLAHIYANEPLIDARSPEEFAGAVIQPAEYPREGAQSAGHIPTATNIPWTASVNPDGTFKAATELREVYQGQGITPDKSVITYGRIGERSAHTWFVVSQLLGYPDVRNYDGSWTEWGSLVRAPISRLDSAGERESSGREGDCER